MVLARIRNCNLHFLLIAFFSQLTVLTIKVVRWKYILEVLKIKVAFGDALKAFWAGLYLAAITPAKVGEISRAYFLKNNNRSITRSTFSVILDRLIDIVCLLFFGLGASIFYLQELGDLHRLFLLLVAALALGIWIVCLKRDLFYSLFKRLLYRFISKEKFPLRENLDLSILKAIRGRHYAIIAIYVLVGWVVYFFGWWFLTKALYIKIPFVQLIAAVSIATVIAMIPVTLSGLGTRDAAMIFIFSKLGIGKESAFSFSLMIFFITITIICIGVFFFFENLKYKGRKIYG